MQNQFTLNKLIDTLRNDPVFANNISYWSCESEEPAKYSAFPPNLSHELVASLGELGIDQLFQHQKRAIDYIQSHQNVVISTGTSSGKSMCYQVPIINSLLGSNEATALLLYPTKALANDQLEGFRQILSFISPGLRSNVLPAIYDGDTPSNQRRSIRDKSRLLLTNPDMLHLGILPHHTNWSEFFSNLRYVVIDEIHMYRGVFGSHFANVIRRLKRVAAFYGSNPVFIMTSATIANPKSLAQSLIGNTVEIISDDTSPKGERNFVIYNPPFINEDIGIREGLSISTQRMINEAFLSNIQTLVFCRTRRFVEQLLSESYKNIKNSTNKIRGYRSGYLKEERREIERGFKSGDIRLAIATNALELGVDIGGIDLVLLAGYPGTIASLKQRAGRAGRSTRPSMTILIASMNPLDQFLAKNPVFLMDLPVEQALVNPDNPLILMEHLQSASFEIPFKDEDGFGQLSGSEISPYLQFLAEQGILHHSSNRYFWAADDYPSTHISLRSTQSNTILLIHQDNGERSVIGEVDYMSSLWMVHPGAIYLHGGDSFSVTELDLKKGVAILSECKEDYFTEPVQSVDINVLSREKEIDLSRYSIHFGEVEVTSKVESYKKIKWSSQELLSTEKLELPQTNLRTFGYWLVLKEECISEMKRQGNWYSDVNNYGTEWENTRDTVRRRDNYICQGCGVVEIGGQHHVHHKVPFKMISDPKIANQIDNLITLCTNCHKQAETQVRIRSALSGLNYVFSALAPFLVMCDVNDLGSVVDPAANFSEKKPTIMIYDHIPAGIGLADNLFKRSEELLRNSKTLISECDCMDGCPSCVGPSVENGIGGKKETLALLDILLEG